jgi:hypothetical protein
LVARNCSNPNTVVARARQLYWGWQKLLHSNVREYPVRTPPKVNQVRISRW